MTVFEQRMYRDPARQYEEKMERSCAGCVYSKIAFDKPYCDKGKKHVKKCTSYKEKA